MSLTYRIGAIFYVFWGLLHIYAAYLGFQLAAGQDAGEIQGKLNQNAWNLALLSVFVIFVAVRYNWRNSTTGYWTNAIMISAIDIGFLVLLYFPGYNTDLIGPIIWIIGLILTTIGFLTQPRTR